MLDTTLQIWVNDTPYDCDYEFDFDEHENVIAIMYQATSEDGENVSVNSETWNVLADHEDIAEYIERHEEEIREALEDFNLQRD